MDNFTDINARTIDKQADSLDDVEWDARTLGSLAQDAREKFLRIALEIVVRI